MKLNTGSFYSYLHYIIAVYCVPQYCALKLFIYSRFTKKVKLRLVIKSGSGTVGQNVADRSCKSITSEEKKYVIRRMGGWQLC